MISTSNIEQVASLYKQKDEPITSYSENHRDLLRNADYIPRFYQNRQDYSIPSYFLSGVDQNLKALPTRYTFEQHVFCRIICEFSSLPSRAVVMVSTDENIYQDIRKTIIPLKRTQLKKALLDLQKKHNIAYALIPRRNVYLTPINIGSLTPNFDAYSKYVQ